MTEPTLHTFAGWVDPVVVQMIVDGFILVDDEWKNAVALW